MDKISIVGGFSTSASSYTNTDVETTHKTNIKFWDTIGSDILGTTALPKYGGFMSEDKLHLFGNVSNKRVLEIGCGNGHSLKYVSDIGADELWGLDISPEQVKRTQNYLLSKNINAKIICSPMENDCKIPSDYFDIVYAVYSIGWTTDLNKTFNKVYSYLKKGGIFIFSWSHPIHKCVSLENNQLVFLNSYFDESWYSFSLGDEKIMLSNRMLSTYINALSSNGFMIEQLIEENDSELLNESKDTDFSKKAQMLPVTFIIKARKI